MIPGVGRRALAGATALLALAGPAAAFVDTPEHQLASLFMRLVQTEDALDVSGDDGAGVHPLFGKMDALLAEAARVRPDTDAAFGIKAGIVQRWGNDWAAGGMVGKWLLHDLMARGRFGL